MSREPTAEDELAVLQRALDRRRHPSNASGLATPGEVARPKNGTGGGKVPN